MIGGNVFQGAQSAGNPMDLSSMLNPSDETSSSHHSNTAIGAGGKSIDSLIRHINPAALLSPPKLESGPLDQYQPRKDSRQPVFYGSSPPQNNQYVQLPPINMEQMQYDDNPSRKTCRLLSIHPSSPQDFKNSRRQADSPTFHGYPTPPSSLNGSPRHHLSDHPQYLSQSAPTNFSHDQHFPRTTSRASLSHHRRAQQEQHVRDTYSTVPLHHIRADRSPSYEYENAQVRTGPSSSCYDTPLPPKLPKPPHSNKPYTLEQVHWIRYHREDYRLSWPILLRHFRRRFPDYPRISIQCLSSRYYRDNKVPMLDEHGEQVLDANGKVLMVACKVRGRNTKEGKDIPYLFVDMHPDFAGVYEWVKLEDRMRARRIVEGLEREVGRVEEMSEWKRYQHSLRKIDLQSQELQMRWAQIEQQNQKLPLQLDQKGGK